MPTDKTISRGLIPRGAPLIFCTAHLLLHTNLLKKEVGQYLLHFLNFGWVQNFNADRQNHLPRAIPTRSAIEFLHCTSPPSYQSIKKRSRSIPITLLKFWVGTRFVMLKDKNMSPEGFSQAERNFFLPCTPPHSYQSIKKISMSIPMTVLKFWVGTRFVTTTTTTPPTTPPTTTTNDAAEDHNTLSGQSPSG